MQLSPDLCSTPLPPPFPADAIPSAAGTSGCFRRGDSWNLKMGPARQVGKGNAGRGQVRAILNPCYQVFPRQKNLQFPRQCTQLKSPCPSRCPFTSLQVPEKFVLSSLPWQWSPSSSSHLSSPVWVTAIEPQAGFGGLSSWKSNVFPL